MEIEQCFELSCRSEVEYSCECSSPNTYSCKLHLAEHLESSALVHNFKPIFLKPINETKKMLLGYFEKEKSKQYELRRKIVDSFIQNLQKSENSLEEQLEKLDSNLFEIDNAIQKIFQAQKISKFKQDPVLLLLTLNPDEAIEKAKEIFQTKSYFSENSQLVSENAPETNAESLIREKFDMFLNLLCKIEKILEDYQLSLINLNNHPRLFIAANSEIGDSYFSEINQSISNLMKNIEAIKIEFKDLKEMPWKNAQNIAEKDTSQTQALVQKLKDRTSEILNRANDPESEQYFRNNRLSYDIHLKEINSSDPSLSQAYQEYISAYLQMSSLYLTRGGTAGKTNLIIYDTEHEIKEIKIFNTTDSLNYGTCTAQLPNGELFFFGKTNPTSGITLIIDKNKEIRVLPSGTPCCVSSAIYFNRNIYCFGGWNNEKALTVSERFNLDRNQWIKLNPLPQADWLCHSIIFGKNILISGSQNRNILKYSIENNNFVIIPFQFAQGRRKILIKVERLYLIECYNGMIYESEIGDETVWKQVSASIIKEMYPHQVYCSYNKGAIYMGVNLKNMQEWYKFYLGQKLMVEL